MPDRALVTGCAGFLGSRLAERLVRAGAEVIGIDRFADFYPRRIKEQNLAALRESSSFTLRELDLASEPLDDVLEGVDGVYGPRQRPDMVFSRFIAAALADDPITILGDGLGGARLHLRRRRDRRHAGRCRQRQARRRVQRRRRDAGHPARRDPGARGADRPPDSGRASRVPPGATRGRRAPTPRLPERSSASLRRSPSRTAWPVRSSGPPSCARRRSGPRPRWRFASLYKRLIAAPQTSGSGRADADWLQPPLSQEGLGRFLRTVKERRRLVLLVLAAVLGAAVIYLLVAEEVYEARADILVTPVPTQEAVLATVGLITQSVDPTLDVETANQLIDSPAVADRAAESLGGGENGEDLLGVTSVAPIPESNIVTVTASGPTPDAAAARANAFAQAAVVERRNVIASSIDALLPKLEGDLAASENASAANSLSDTIAALSAFRASGNATIQVETAASPPTSASSPRTVLVLVAALIVGLVLGIGAIFAAQALDPRLRREEQLRSLFNLPILARIPHERPQKGPLAPERLSPMAREAYRTLRASVLAASQDELGPHLILVGGSGPSEGKSTTAINLSASLALAGHSVILIDADLRRPAIAESLDISDRQGVVSVLLGRASLSEALEPAPSYDGNLRVLTADQTGADFADLFSLPAARRLLEEAERLADYVIIDSPPLSDVVDALQLAQRADAVLLVARLGHSRISKIRELGELLAGSGIRPAGFALLGTPRGDRKGYAYFEEGPPQRPVAERPVSTR